MYFVLCEQDKTVNMYGRQLVDVLTWVYKLCSLIVEVELSTMYWQKKVLEREL